MTKFAPRLMVLFLCGSALAGCADADISALTGGKTAAVQAKAEISNITKTPPADLDSGVRQAQLLRQAGHYDEAVHILSQLMLVASDDPRVVGEYGKTLAEMGRAQDAAQFLSRAIQLQPNDWTAYSAMGVAYDQLGDQVSARVAYEHALSLQPGEASILNNYALSRMLANDPDGARRLIERASALGGGTDPKIARNIALLNELAPDPKAPHGVAAIASTLQSLVPDVLTAKSKPATATPAPLVPAPPRAVAGMPRPLVASPQQQIQQQQMQQQQMPQPRQVAQQAAPTVVMQAVPFDPYAGPVAPRLQLHMPKKVAKAKAPLKAEDDVMAAVKAAEAALPVKAASAAPVAKAPAKPAAEAKPAAKGPVKTADAKSKNGVPALRMAADKY